MNKPISTFQEIYAFVSQVPSGKVTTYGQVARKIGVNNPKVVGYALNSEAMPDYVPWHRVVNSKGTVSKRNLGDGELLQEKLLISEGIKFDKTKKIAMKDHLLDI
tara:strand:+ start:2609 stop:2923 length:315 start_codon:yes stop_codon:yes gene_type:complete